jgi:hypothetical protein
MADLTPDDVAAAINNAGYSAEDLTALLVVGKLQVQRGKLAAEIDKLQHDRQGYDSNVESQIQEKQSAIADIDGQLRNLV